MFGWPPGEHELLAAIFALFGEPTETTWPGVSRLPLFNQVCLGRDRSPARASLCPAAVTWLQPGAVDKFTAGSLEAGLVAALQGTVAMRPDSRLTASTAGAIFEHAAVLPVAKPATMPVAPWPDPGLQLACFPGSSRPPTGPPTQPPQPPTKPPQPPQPPQPPTTLCACTGDGCGPPCSERGLSAGWCHRPSHRGSFCRECRDARGAKVGPDKPNRKPNSTSHPLPSCQTVSI